MPKQVKAYFKSLYTMNLKALGIIYVIPLFIDIIQILYMVYLVSVGVDLRKGHRAVLLIMMFMIGNSHSSSSFDGLISIRGNRKAFLKGCILAMIANSIVLTIVDVGVMNFITFIGSFPKRHDDLQIVYYDLKDIGINIVLYLGAASSGFFIGSLDYVLTKNLFVILLMMIAGGFYKTFIGGGLTRAQYAILTEIFFEGGIWRYVWCIPLFIIGGILLLYKAPIKTYAHGLGEKR